jgi:uncharacterized membrane protein YbhN (UPF0104 family)
VAVGTALPLLLVWRLGTGPFLAGIRGLDPGLLVLGLLIGVVVTTSCAWRWRLVARAVGIPLSLRAATSACYRAQFLNTVLPGGVLGDVDRGLRHGARVLDRARALRAVAWERGSGQAVQVGVTVVLLAFLPSPLGTVAPTILAGTVILAVVAAVVAGVVGHRGPLRAEAVAVLGRRTLPGVVGSSLLATTGHVVTFVVAAREVGVVASTAVLVPLALLVLVAMAVPVGLGGWGPREGAAAWAFAAVGLDVGQGVAAAVVFGVMSLAAGLPGLVLLVGGRIAADRSRRRPAPAASEVTGRG